MCTVVIGPPTCRLEKEMFEQRCAVEEWSNKEVRKARCDNETEA